MRRLLSLAWLCARIKYWNLRCRLEFWKVRRQIRKNPGLSSVDIPAWALFKPLELLAESIHFSQTRKEDADVRTTV